MTVTVTVNNKKSSLDDFSTPQKIGMGAMLVFGVGILGVATVGMCMAVWGGLTLLMGGGPGTLLWGAGLFLGAKLSSKALEKGVILAEKMGVLTPLNETPEPAAAVSTLAPLVPDFNHEAAVTLENKISIRPVIKLKSKANDLGQP